MKFLSSLGLSLVLSALFITTAFAEDTTPTVEAGAEVVADSELSTEDAEMLEDTEALETTEVSTVEGKGMIDSMCGCGYWGNLGYDVSVTSQAKATGISVNTNYYVTGAESKKAAAEELNAKFTDLKKSLDRYGKVTRTGIYTYQNWEYTNTFDGSLSIRIDLSDMDNKEILENWLYEEGMEVWTDVKVSNLTEVEAAASHAIKLAMNAKEKLYEDLLGYDLGERTGLGIWSWVDASTYDNSTGMVTVNTTVNVSFMPKAMPY